MPVHCYADYTQLYYPLNQKRMNELEVRDHLKKDALKHSRPMHINALKRNDRKTEFMLLSTKDPLKKSITKSVTIGNCNIKAAESLRNIGAVFDSEMKMDVQV